MTTCNKSSLKFEVNVSINEDYTEGGRFIGVKPEGLTLENLDRLTAIHGETWIKGYLAAVQLNTIEISEILMPSQDACGIPQSSHKVRSSLKRYWAVNKSLLSAISIQRTTSSSIYSKHKPEL